MTSMQSEGVNTSPPPCQLTPASTDRRWPPGLSNELKYRVLHFTPSWFSVTMGTGITSAILFNLPYQFTGLSTIATIVFVLNVILFILFTFTSVLRYIIWPSIFPLMILHPVQSLFLGTFAMGFATIIDGIVFIAVPAFGQPFVTLAWVLWWIDSIISMVIAIGLPFMMFTRHKHETASVTAVWLLPVVSPIVAAAAGGIVANVLPPTEARITIIVSYIMLGTGLFPALLIMALYFQRLAIHKCPPSTVIVSVFLPIGPCGQSAFALLQLSNAIRKLQQETGVGLGGANVFSPLEQEMISAAISGGSLIAALFLWGFGFFWLVIAIGTVVDLALNGGFPFNMGWFAFTFPLGTLCTATILLYKTTEFEGFRIVAMIFSCAVILLWFYVGMRTTVEAFAGTIFVAPCLGPSGAPPPPRSHKSDHHQKEMNICSGTTMTCSA